jgi:predicted AAA+ superfamily ATPase
VLGGLIEAFLDRDASDFFRIRRPDAMRKLLHLAAGQVGSLVNLTEWASLTGVSRETVQEYLEILANSHLVHLVPVFAGGRRAELTATPKVFLVDTGIRNALVRDFRPLDERQDAGATLENWVYGELVKNVGPSAQVRYWRTRSGAEVDFVVDDGSTPIGLEVKAAALRRPQLSRSARSFIEAYQPRRFLVVNRELEHEEVVAGTTVRWLRAETFGGDVRAAVLGAEAV